MNLITAIIKNIDRVHTNGIQSNSDDNPFVGMKNEGSTALSLEDTLKILRRSIEHRKKKCSQVERKLTEIEVDEKGLGEEIEKDEASQESLREKSKFFAQYKSMVLNAVQSYKDIVSKIEQMYSVQDGIWNDQFQACILNPVKSDAPWNSGAVRVYRYLQLKTYMLVESHFWRRQVRDGLFIKPFEQISGVKTFFKEWKNKYPN